MTEEEIRFECLKLADGNLHEAAKLADFCLNGNVSGNPGGMKTAGEEMLNIDARNPNAITLGNVLERGI